MHAAFTEEYLWFTASFLLFPSRPSDYLPHEQAISCAFQPSAEGRAMTHKQAVLCGTSTPAPHNRRRRGSTSSATEPVDQLTSGAPLLAEQGLEQGTQPLSAASSSRFRSTPQRYPVSDPSAPTTRCHGTINATRLVAHARATARVELGSPISRASSL